MQSTILSLIILLVTAIWLVIKYRYELQMFQQNSYRNERFFKWLKKGNLKTQARTIEVILCALVLITIFTDFIPTVAIAFLGYIWLINKQLTKKSKVKLKFTPRAKRLYFTSIGVIILAIIIVGLITNQFLKTAAAVAPIASVLSCLILPLSNIILKPVENHINNWYINDAKRILNEHKDLIIIGITGSYGKTSTKHFLEKILSQKYNVLMTPGSFNTTMGVVRTIREYLKPIHQIFICEMGAKQIGDIKEICDLVHPKYGILTSVAEQHLDTFINIENVCKTKFELIDSLPEDGCAFLNADYDIIKLRPVKCNAVYYSTTSNGNYTADMSTLKYSQLGTEFSVNINNVETHTFKTPLLGDYNISNILACIACAQKLQLSTEQIAYGIHKLESVEHRMQISTNSAGVNIIDDAFNSNPKGAKMALQVLSNFKGQRFVITPGIIELADKQDYYNQILGEQIADCVDYAILVGKKQTEPIYQGLKNKNFPEDKIYIAQSLNDAANWAFTRTAKGDTILFENDLPDTFN